MISRRIIAWGTLFTPLLAILCVAASVPPRTRVSERTFEFTYLTKIPASPVGAKTLRVWIPVPQSDPYQAIGGLQIQSPFPYVKHREAEYGNEYLYLQFSGRASEIPRRSPHKFSGNASGTRSRSSLPPPRWPAAAASAHRSASRTLRAADRRWPSGPSSSPAAPASRLPA